MGPFAGCHEVLEHPSAMLGIVDLGVELQAEAISCLILHPLNRARFAKCCNSVSWRGLRNLVVVALPDCLLIGCSLKDGASALN